MPYLKVIVMLLVALAVVYAAKLLVPTASVEQVMHSSWDQLLLYLEFAAGMIFIVSFLIKEIRASAKDIPADAPSRGPTWTWSEIGQFFVVVFGSFGGFVALVAFSQWLADPAHAN
jgi:hypothetical protein